MNNRSILIAITIACVALLASAEIVGDYGHQHDGTSVDPDGNQKRNAEMVWFEVPAGKTATVAHYNWDTTGYYEAKIVVYKDDAKKTEVMRFANKDPRHERNTDAVLQPGIRYYFTAWHKAGEMSMPWEPSHARLLVKTDKTYELQVDDGVAGTSKGDFDFNDSNLLITVK